MGSKGGGYQTTVKRGRPIVVSLLQTLSIQEPESDGFAGLSLRSESTRGEGGFRRENSHLWRGSLGGTRRKMF